MKNPLINTLVSLRGNPRACVYTEPMWGLSMMLCLPFASLYMSAMGLSDTQIGLITTVYMLVRVIFSFLSGAIIDKIGRRPATALFDFISWCIPCLIWAFAQNFWFFLAAALFNGIMMVTTNSWDCLLVEDAPKEQITKIYSLIIVCGHVSALFAPIALFLVDRLTLVPAMRILYINAFVVMLVKLLILYFWSHETQTGIIRKRETKGKSLFSLLGGYKGVLKLGLSSRGTLFALVISAIVGVLSMVNNTFWQILVNQNIGVPETILPLFAMLRSLFAIFFFFLVISRTHQKNMKKPLLLGFLGYFAGQSALLLTPDGAGAGSYIFLCASLALDGFGAGLLAMLAESLVALHVDPDQRAQVLGLLQMTVMLASAPFGWIAGLLSDISRIFPFVMNLILIVLGLLVTMFFYRSKLPPTAAQQPSARDA